MSGLYFKHLLSLIILFTSLSTAIGQTIPVDANGVKVVCVADGDKLDKHLKGDDKKAIRKLIIKDNSTKPYRAFYNNESGSWLKSFTKDFFSVLKKLPNLEEIDASESAGASCELARNYSDVSLNIRKLTLRSEDGFMKVNYGELGQGDPTVDIIMEYLDICRKFNSERPSDIHMMNLREKMYPQLEEFVLAGLIKFADSHIPDSLFVNIPQRNGSLPIILPKEGKLCFSNVKNNPTFKYNVIVDNGDPITEKDMEGVFFTDDSFIRRLNQQKYVLPASVRFIVKCENRLPEGKLNTLEFAPSPNQIFVGNDVFDKLNVKNVIFNRPAAILCKFHNLDSLVFNKTAFLPKTYYYHSNLQGIKNLIFNDYAIIEEGCGGSGHEMVVFKNGGTIQNEAFGEVGTIRFEKKPTISDKYGFPKIVYVPEGCKANFPKTGNYSHAAATIYEILPEKVAKEMIGRSIELKTPGSLLSVISPSELSKVDSLTVVGIMNEADAKVLTELGTNVSYLNLRDCIIINSEDESGVKHCIIPSGFMKGNPALQEVILPRTAIHFSHYGILNDCPRLKKIVLPPHLETIGFNNIQNCPSLEEIIFPKSVTYIAGNSNDNTCLFNCPNLKKVIFNGSLLNYNTFLCRDGGTTLKEVRLPGYKSWAGGYSHAIGTYHNPLQNATVYIPDNAPSFTGQYINCNMYFQSPKAHYRVGNDLKLENCIIHCPKGAMTSYYSVFGKDNEYVESDYPVPVVEKDEYALKYISNQKQLERKLEETKAKKADAEWRRKYGNNAEPCMQCYGTGIQNRKVGNTYYPKFCPYCNGSGVVRKK